MTQQIRQITGEKPMRWIALAMAALCSSAGAILPDSGWYYNAAESGRGFNIEIQDTTLFVAAFGYNSGGSAIWLVSGGPMTGDHSYTGSLIQATGGACFGCPPSSATGVSAGTINITFTSSSSAQITLNGATVSVTREAFGFDMSNHVTPLLGEWGFVIGTHTVPSYFGERVSLFTTTTGSSGVFAAGGRSGATSTHVAVGNFDTATQVWGILVDSSTSYWDFYTFQFVDFNRIEGRNYTYLKTSSPSGYLPFIGTRFKSSAAAAGLAGPGTVTSAAPAARDDDELASVKAASATMFAPPDLDLVHRLEASMRFAREN